MEGVDLPELDLSVDTVEVTEDATTETTYTIALAMQPSDTVSVQIVVLFSSISNIVNPTTGYPYTTYFTTTNWDEPKSITVFGVTDDDALHESNEIRHRIPIDGIDHITAIMPVVVTDDEAPPTATLKSTTSGVTFPEFTRMAEGYSYDGSFTLDEGDTATYTVELSAEPTGDLTVNLSLPRHEEAISISPSSITFTKSGEASDPAKWEWDDPQTATLRALNDVDTLDERGIVQHKTTVGGEVYTLGLVRAVTVDSALPRLTFDPATRTITVDEGGTATYTVVLDSDPGAGAAATVSVEVDDSESTGRAVTIWTETLTFTGGASGNWDEPQTVTITGDRDGDQFDDLVEIDHIVTVGTRTILRPSVQVTVVDGNRAPYFPEGPDTIRRVAEDAAAGHEVGDPVTALDLNPSDILNYSLQDPEGNFNINSGTGQIEVAASASLDYETAQTHLVDVAVTDAGGLRDGIEIRVFVTDVNDPLEVTGNNAPTFNENTSITTPVAHYTAQDPEGYSHSFTWTVEGRDASYFSIDATGSLKFNSQPDHEAKDSYSIIIVATDPPDRGDLLVTVTVTDVNEAPEIRGSNSQTYQENQTHPVTTFGFIDREGDDVAWSLSGTDRGDFTITETGTGDSELRFASTPDYERPADSGGDNIYNVTVVATDDGTPVEVGRLDVTITVNNLNEAPSISGDDALSYPENTPTTRVLDRYSATDPERGTITWSLDGDDRDDFSIDQSGNLTFASAPDFESPTDAGGNNEYQVTVVATDNGSPPLAGRFDVIVFVTPINEPPTVSGQTSHHVDEGNTTFAAFYLADDPEGRTTTFTWSLSSTDGGDFQISEVGELNFRNAPDHERPADSNRDNVYLVTVSASDGQYTGTLNVTINVNNINEAPSISGDDALSYPENTPTTRVLDRYSATDPERGTITWSLDGDDRDDFSIDQSGNLTFASAPDFESPTDAGGNNEYQVTVVATDNGSPPLAGRFDVIVFVTPINEPPTVRGQTSHHVDEGNTTFAAFYFADDPEGSSTTFTWSLSSTDGGDFQISEFGELNFRNTPDHERPADSNRNNVYLVTVSASDGQYTGTLNVTINVNNINEAPSISGDDALSYPENTPTTRVLDRYSATDPERGTITWSLDGNDRDDFSIDQSGNPTFASEPDFERPSGSAGNNEYEVTVVAADDGNPTLSGRFDVTVTVADQNEGPEITGNQTLTFDENHGTAQVLATYFATDPENPAAEITRWSLAGRDGGDFLINEQGELRFRYAPDYERPADSNRDNEYLVTVRASDGRYYGSLDARVTVTNLNEPPEIRTGSRTEFTYRENGTNSLYTYRASDPERGTIAWELAGDDNDDFTVSGTGVLTFASPPDYETPGGSGLDGTVPGNGGGPGRRRPHRQSGSNG